MVHPVRLPELERSPLPNCHSGSLKEELLQARCADHRQSSIDFSNSCSENITFEKRFYNTWQTLLAYICGFIVQMVDFLRRIGLVSAEATFSIDKNESRDSVNGGQFYSKSPTPEATLSAFPIHSVTQDKTAPECGFPFDSIPVQSFKMNSIQYRALSKTKDEPVGEASELQLNSDDAQFTQEQVKQQNQSSIDNIEKSDLDLFVDELLSEINVLHEAVGRGSSTAPIQESQNQLLNHDVDTPCPPIDLFADSLSEPQDKMDGLPLSSSLRVSQNEENEKVLDELLSELNALRETKRMGTATHTPRPISTLRSLSVRGEEEVTRDKIKSELKGYIDKTSEEPQDKLLLYSELVESLKDIENIDMQEHFRLMCRVEIFLQTCRPIAPAMSSGRDVLKKHYEEDLQLYEEQTQRTRGLFAMWSQGLYSQEIELCQCRVMQEAVRFVMRVFPKAAQEEYFRMAEIVSKMNISNEGWFVQLRQSMQALFDKYHTRRRTQNDAAASMMLTQFGAQPERGNVLGDVNAALGALAVACGIECSERCLIVVSGLNDPLLRRKSQDVINN